jgi:hypothetical protein
MQIYFMQVKGTNVKADMFHDYHDMFFVLVALRADVSA